MTQKNEVASFINVQDLSPFEGGCLLFLKPSRVSDFASSLSGGSTFHDTVPQTLLDGMNPETHSVPQTASDHASVVVG